jgi:hypothetical protein
VGAAAASSRSQAVTQPQSTTGYAAAAA